MPNFLTSLRLMAVPLMIWLLISQHFAITFVVFACASLTDAMDGFIAKRFGLVTELGTYLDPIADKALLVTMISIFGIQGILPIWLVILLIGRDILIIQAIVFAFFFANPLNIAPSFLSKINTCVQMLSISFILLYLAFFSFLSAFIPWIEIIMAFFAFLSLLHYTYLWKNHFCSKRDTQ